MNQKTVDAVNRLGRFLGQRDLKELTRKELKEKTGLEQADLLVLFGGSILEGADELAKGIINDIAKHTIIVGGAGHTTETLREQVRHYAPDIDVDGQPEAQIFQNWLQSRYGLQADYLECESTNCGNNITFLLNLIEKNQIPVQSVILMQDASMQKRMEACLYKYKPDWTILNYAAYQSDVMLKDGKTEFDKELKGMWSMDRYLSLLMGEIPRLQDDENGYGPKGKGFIAHVEIPKDVRDAFEELRKAFPDLVREANPAYEKPQDK